MGRVSSIYEQSVLLALLDGAGAEREAVPTSVEMHDFVYGLDDCERTRAWLLTSACGRPGCASDYAWIPRGWSHIMYK